MDIFGFFIFISIFLFYFFGAVDMMIVDDECQKTINVVAVGPVLFRAHLYISIYLYLIYTEMPIYV